MSDRKSASKKMLSVVIPAYNAGDLLKTCLDSVLSLPYDCEVIVVDDGSTDGSTDVVAYYGNSIRFIRQPNRGVSAARNAGLSIAQGEWVWFVDADDYVLLTDEETDKTSVLDAIGISSLVVLPFVWKEGGQSNRFAAFDGEVPYNLWRCWFRRSELLRQGLRFNENHRYAEDQEFILTYLLRSGIGTKALPMPTYYYTMRPSGAMMKAGTKRRQLSDIAAVILTFARTAIATRSCFHLWVWQQQKRLLRTWWTVLWGK